MSILIKGMKMPAMCELCPFSGISGKSCELVSCTFTGEHRFFNDGQFMSGCPLVELPPHGRLGDLDKLEQMFVDIDNAPYSAFDGEEPFYTAEDAAQIIRLAPTIIERESGT